MSAEAYVIFEDTTWYKKYKEEIREQIFLLDTYVRHPIQIGNYLIKEGEYWLKGIESKPPPADWPYSVRIFLDKEDYIFIEISAHPPSIERTLTQFLNWIRKQTPIFFQDEDGEDFGYYLLKLNLKCKTTKNNVINSYKEDYFFDRKIREDRVLDDLDRLFQN